MSLPVMVDVAIGLVGLFLALSLIASFVLEIYVGMFNRHGRLLRKAVGQLLNDASGKGLAAQLYDHPLIQGLKSGMRLPSTIPAPIFARAMIDLMDRSGALQSGMVADVLKPLMTVTQGEREKLIKELETWFDLGLERMSGSIARRSQMWLVPIAAILTLALNINALKVYEALSTQEALRAAGVKSAQALLSEVGGSFEDGEEAPTPDEGEPADGEGKKPGDTAKGAAEAPNAVFAQLAKIAAAQAKLRTASEQRKAAEAEVAAGAADAQGKLDQATESEKMAKDELDQLAKTVQEFAADKAALEAQINAFHDMFGGLPMGWSCASTDEVLAKLTGATPKAGSDTDARPSTFSCVRAGIAKSSYLDWIGWIITIIAISFGAQFWYRALKSLIKIRSLVPSKPKESKKAGAKG